MSELNERLRAFYAQQIETIKQIASTGVSKPLLIKVPDGYEESKVRLMVVGQQTWGWGTDGWDVEELMHEYERFAMGSHYRGSPFHQVARKLYRDLNPGGQPNAFVWSNLFKVDQDSNRPMGIVADEITKLQILQKEIEITKPQTVVFFSGPDYDNQLELTFPGVKYAALLPEVDKPRLAKLEHHLLPPRSYRTYHPNFLYRSPLGRQIKEPIIEAMIQDIERA